MMRPIRTANVSMDDGGPVIDDGSVSMDTGRFIDGSISVNDGSAGMDGAATNDAGTMMNDAGIMMNDAGALIDDAGMGLGAVRALALGDSHTCALLGTGAVRCWGSSRYGQLGYGNTNNLGDNETPASAGDVPLGASAIQVAAGAEHTCVLLDTGAVRCWGSAQYDQIGYGNTNNLGDNETAASAADISLGAAAIQITAGRWHTCAILDTGGVRCWGFGWYGQLGYASTSTIGDNETPASAGDVAIGAIASQVALGFYHTCALLVTGSIRCWGNNVRGELGYGNVITIGDNETPASAGDVPFR
jgi:alpha-tubulin suppressor-like RCC1 family protein